MKNIIDNNDLVGQIALGQVQGFDMYGNRLRYSPNSSTEWKVELSIYEGERTVFRPSHLKEVVWEEYNPDLGIWVK